MFTTSPWRQAGAEFVGTYALVTAGCGAIVVNTLTGALSHVGVACSFGLVITVMIAAAGVRWLRDCRDRCKSPFVSRTVRSEL